MVGEALLWDKAKAAGTFDPTQLEVTEEEITKTLEMLVQRSKIEKQFLNRYFEEAVPDMSYRQLWWLTGQDYEVTGNAYWEIMRDTSGRVARFQWLPSVSVRATPQGSKQIAATKTVRDSLLGWEDTAQIRRFRKYVQLRHQGHVRGNHESGHIAAWFKEFGDPRIMSRETGKYYASLESLQQAEGDGERGVPLARPATEVLHFRVLFGGSSVYGKPRHSGIYPGLVGSRDLDEENLRIVGDEAVPAMMILVSGGIVGAKSYERLKSQIENRKKGRKGIMIVEAVSTGKGAGMVHPQQQPNLSIERLSKEQKTDMLFQKYDLRNEDKADGIWRIPKLALGKAEGQTNKAAVTATKQFVEDQVYAPKRADRDEIIQQNILANLDIRTWNYETQSTEPRDPQTRAEILKLLVEGGILTPNEARELTEPIFNQPLDDLKGLWTMFPPRTLTVLLQTKNADLAAALLGEDKQALARLSDAVRDHLGLGAGGAGATTVPDAVTGDVGVKDAGVKGAEPSSSGPGSA